MDSFDFNSEFALTGCGSKSFDIVSERDQEVGLPLPDHHPPATGTDEAIQVLDPTHRVPRRKSSLIAEPKGAAKRQAIPLMQPNLVLPAAYSSRPGGADEAIMPLKTLGALPRRQSRKNSVGLAADGNEGAGHLNYGAQAALARPLINNPETPTATQVVIGSGDGAHNRGDALLSSSPVVAEIRGLYRLRRQWLKAELKLVLQAQAICRDYTEGNKEEAAKLYHSVVKGTANNIAVEIALAPFLAGIEPFRKEGAAYDKRLAKLARSHPLWPFVKGIWGFSDIGLAKIIGEVGEIADYRSPACLWKRLGLAPHQGRSADTWRRKGGLSADDWTALGYSPSRRSTMWNIGGGLIGGMGNGVRPAVDEDWQAREDWSPYQKVYVARLIYEAERDPENMARPVTAAGKLSFSKWAHNRAKRIVEKQAIKDLWVEARRLAGAQS